MSLFRRIFGREGQASPDRVATAPLDPSSLDATVPEESHRHPSVGAARSVGLHRTQDDDSLLMLTGGSDGHNGMIDFGLYCVADGLGGYEGGNVASSIAVRVLARQVTQGAFLRLFAVEPHEAEEEEPLEDLVTQAFIAANTAVLERASGSATTLTALMLVGKHFLVGHVGDTRAYLVSEEAIEQLTVDHSHAQKLVETGAISKEEAQVSPHRNKLWNAIGKGEQLKVDVLTHPVEEDSSLLLCSDGLWGELTDEQIQSIILMSKDPQTACETLVAAANQAGGKDNITAIIVYIPPK